VTLAPALLTPTAALRRGFELPPEAALEAGAAVARSRASAEVTGQQIRQGFRVGPLPLMIGYADGSELTEMPAVYRLPHAPDWLLGMANLHGMLVPVFDLTRHFGITREAPAKPMLLVLAHGNDATGIVIDGLPERLRWDASHVADAATVPDALAAVVQRPVLIGETLWLDLDCSALLARLEQALVARH
jgi:twitching motility protein PilI